MPARGIGEQGEEEVEEKTMYEEESGYFFWSMSGELIYRHHEVHRTKLFVWDATTFSIPLGCLNVMRQARTNIDNASQRTLEDSGIMTEESCSQRNGLEQLVSKP